MIFLACWMGFGVMFLFCGGGVKDGKVDGRCMYVRFDNFCISYSL